MRNHPIKLVECPRDAMQGLHDFIPTNLKAAYLNLLLQVGFDTIDFGSFVSPKAIPQMRDTAAVLDLLDLPAGGSRLLAIVANVRGAEEAAQHAQIDYLGFPFSISETFQQRNTNSSMAASVDTIKRLLEICSAKDKTAVIYLSMGFGNPYGDEWSPQLVTDWAGRLVSEGAGILSLADTTGVSTARQIRELLPVLTNSLPEAEIGLHLHATPGQRLEKITAAFEAGCSRFDSALRGYGGCPMASDQLTGNIATEEVIGYLNAQNQLPPLNFEKWEEAIQLSGSIFH
ncbi:hydroxymethylglutaryl-CoA lyase [Pedobacter sp. SYP-B3415]|uniref:hydroxymethylglutaryl-CoA lyase n=1 Tax=Pedobacter sp. SYP-B3415 TaxID=2496641 RepID=UPI00101D2703|nr:hydroxymethylglutaryl-CoA lyase [Pedobacter sp. SYP-B3415]